MKDYAKYYDKSWYIYDFEKKQYNDDGHSLLPEIMYLVSK